MIQLESSWDSYVLFRIQVGLRAGSIKAAASTKEKPAEVASYQVQ
jgi:hypothetical protein